MDIDLVLSIDERFFIKRVLLLLLLVLTPCHAMADSFAVCVANLQHKAKDYGVPASVVEGALAKVQYVPRVIELDRRQPEFTETFADYFNRRVTEDRVSRGRRLLRKHRKLLSDLVKKYGVPAQYLVAFWGLETNFGSYMGKMPILDSLATLACDQRRSTYFTAQLLEALHLLGKPGVQEPLLGSWAGAMGHTQFMPTAYRQYAVDGDGDGLVDLWRSIPDALTSAANFLQGLGWQRNLRWGREVRLRADFDYGDLQLQRKRALADWRKLDVRTTTGSLLANIDIEAALLLPSGYRGPAFIVYENFEVIMGWNRSEFYALSVGHLADRINGAGKLQRPPPTDLPGLTIVKVKALQTKLNDLGFNAGKPDGILGPVTRQAIRAFQLTRGLVADGYPRDSVFEALDIKL